MKTCIVKGFVDIPATKYYKYHGMIMPCNIQPDPVCFVSVDTKLSKWVLIYDDYPPTANSWKRDFDYTLFPPSIYNDICYFKFPDGKRRFYFYEIYFVFVERYPGDFWSVSWDDGLNCTMDGETGITGHFYKSMWGLLEYGFPGEQYCIYLNPSGAGSHVRIWASVEGDLPLTNPVPIDEREW